MYISQMYQLVSFRTSTGNPHGISEENLQSEKLSKSIAAKQCGEPLPAV